jgi:murein L,D-transpeptidase YafK
MTNEGIEEIYLLNVLARNAGQKNILIHIFPFRLNQKNMNIADSVKSKNWMSFWKNLQEVYNYFDNKQEIGNWKCGKSGEYERIL